MWWWSPWWLRLWRLIFDELFWRHLMIHNLIIPHGHLLGHLLVQHLHAYFVLLIWSLVWHLVVIWFFVRRWLQSECGFASNFRSPLWNLRALKLILLGWVPDFLTDQVIHILLLFEAPKLKRKKNLVNKFKINKKERTYFASKHLARSFHFRLMIIFKI